MSYNTLQATLNGAGATPGTSGMAGRYEAVAAWSRSYDERASALVTAATGFARALTHFADIAIASGYNWEWSEYAANRDPNKGPGPSSPRAIPSELPYGAAIAVGVASSKRNGSGLESDFPELYDKITAQLAGGGIPDGDTDKLARAAEAWRRFADSVPVFGAESRLKGVADGLSRSDAPDIPNLVAHLRTLAAGADEIRLAANDLAAATTHHHAALVSVRSEVNTGVAAIIVGASITIAVTVVYIRNPRAVAVEGVTLDSAATAAAGAIGSFFTTLAGIQFGTAALVTTGIAAIAALTIASIANSDDGSGTANPQPGESAATSSAAAKVPNLQGKTLDEAERAIENQGFTQKGETTGGYRRYVHSDGSQVWIRPDGEVIRLGPKVDPGPNAKNYHPRIGPDGQLTDKHSTGETVIR
ncbi:PASTA domain-containing protein [Nocardia noduli]|uniref:PASTA domain-containing protein n=1 Tax=Nocardia noduli TaxID=2815722 RepID=UPI001C2301C2|nr:PASTA domain-containing protein [Nocardia noduli]